MKRKQQEYFNRQKGEIATILTLLGVGILVVGIVAGGKLVEIGSRFIPRAATSCLSNGSPCTLGPQCCSRTCNKTTALIGHCTVGSPSPTPTRTPTPTQAAPTVTPTPTVIGAPTVTVTPTTANVPTPTPTATPVCLPNGNFCTLGSQCCSRTCNKTTYRCTVGSPSPTPTPTRTPTPTQPTPTITPTPTDASNPPTVTPTRTPTPTLTSTPGGSCPTKYSGDANCDGLIRGDDYSIWLNTQCHPGSGQSCPDTRADFQNPPDGNVDDDDYRIWSAHSE